MSDKILIVTALSLEFKEVRKFLSDNEPVTHPSGIVYNKGIYRSPHDTYQVLLIESGTGNIRAADETGRAIEYHQPDFAFLVGVAGGIKDVSVGDVVASTKVIGVETGKADIEFMPRFDSIPASYMLEQIARKVRRDNLWVKRVNDENASKLNSFVEPIAAAEKVVSSNRSNVYKYLRQYCSDAVAVDMEGIGFLVATRPYTVHAIEVRGISDLIENKALADQSGSQPLAARNASAFTFEMIDQISSYTPVRQNIHTLEFRNKLVNKLAELYDRGPEQENIWQRAGGDVSILSNASSRRSQWYDALDKLSKGGGGKGITLESLINEVNSDFPNSSVINDLFN